MPAPRIAKTKLQHDRPPRPGMSRNHIKLIVKLPSLISGVEGDQIVPHHLLRTGERGMGRKSSDRWTIPLTSKEHDALHLDGDEEQHLARFGIDGRAVATALWSATGDLDRMKRVIFRARQLMSLGAGG